MKVVLKEYMNYLIHRSPKVNFLPNNPLTSTRLNYIWTKGDIMQFNAENSSA